MRSNWIRAWLATVAVIVAVAAVARDRVSWLLTVEEPVMDWLLDGTDTSRWEAANFLSSPILLIIGTVVLVLIGLWLDWRIAVAIVITSVIGTVVAVILQSFVGRIPPDPDAAAGSFPSLAVTQTGVFLGLVVLMCWWLRIPKLIWQILVETSVVLTLVVAIRQVLNGEIWPSDAVGSALVIALSLITAAMVFEARPAEFPWKRGAESKKAERSPASGNGAGAITSSPT